MRAKYGSIVTLVEQVHVAPDDHPSSLAAISPGLSRLNAIVPTTILLQQPFASFASLSNLTSASILV